MFDTGEMFLWLLATFRAAGLMMALPFLAVRAVPAVVRMALAGVLGWMVIPLVADTVVYPQGLVELVLLAAKETAVGLLMGMAVRLVFATIEFAAHILAVEIGINPSPEFDPSNGAGGNPVGSGLFYLGILLIFAGAQYAFIYAFVRSFELVPPGLQQPDTGFVSAAVLHTARIFTLGLLMSAPVLAVNFLVNLTFSILGRVVPRMNVFILSFSVRILAGLAMLLLSTGLIVHYVMQQLSETPELMLRLIPFSNL